jgi:hypothetical protein
LGSAFIEETLGGNTMTENKKEHTKIQPNWAFWDLVILAAITALMLILSYFSDVFILIVRFLQRHPEKIVYIDEVVVFFLTISIGLAVYAWRRWAELKKETAERIRNQEELLRVSTTQAEIERIISKQLRSDMDQMKQDVREILHVLLKRHA